MRGRLNKRLGYAACMALGLIATLISSKLVLADTSYGTDGRRNAAIGHYARARSMLVEALAEFEQGRKYAQPDMLIDSEEWRLSVISRTEELNRILDPKPKVTRDGVRFQASPLLIRRERDRTPPVADGAKDSNVYGEQQNREDLRQARARMESTQARDRVVVVPGERSKNTLPADDAKKAAQALSFDDKGAVTQSDDNSVQVPGAVGIPGEPEPSAESRRVVEPSVAPETKPAKLIPNEEEVVTTRPAESPKKGLFNDEEEDEGAPAKTQTVEAKEDEVTKEIERAIQERMQKEKKDKAVEAAEGETK